MAGMVELEYLGNIFSILTRSETLHVQYNACKSKSFENRKFLKIISGINVMIRSITKSLIIFKKPRKMTMISSITIYSSARSDGHHQSV